MRVFLDRLVRLLAMGCWHPGHCHLLWSAYPAFAEEYEAMPSPAGPASVHPDPVDSEPVGQLPRMRAADE
jgi:hypothetical protein